MDFVATFPPADRIALYELLVRTQPEVERRGMTMPYTSVNGNMFSYLNADGSVALRLSATDRAEFMEQRRALMNTWADYIDILRLGAQIIPLKAA